MSNYSFPAAKNDLPMGIEDYKIKDRQMRASSEWSKYHAARFARLNLVARGKNKGAWSAKKNNRAQWIMVSVFPRCHWTFLSFLPYITF